MIQGVFTVSGIIVLDEPKISFDQEALKLNPIYAVPLVSPIQGPYASS